jgi:hypothetical protein
MKDPKHFFYVEIWLSCTRHRGVINSTVTCTAVSMIPLLHAQWYHWHHWDKHSCVNDTAVTCKAMSITPLCKYDTIVNLDHIFNLLLLPLNGISIEKICIGKLYYNTPLTLRQRMGYTKDRFWPQWCPRHCCAQNQLFHFFVNLKPYLKRF